MHIGILAAGAHAAANNSPFTVSEAVILKTPSYQEAWETSYFGANVLHPRTIIPVMCYGIPIIIRNIFNLSAPGTMICRTTVGENGSDQKLETPVKGFATIDNLALVNVEGTGMAGVPGAASTIFGAVKAVNVIMISQALGYQVRSQRNQVRSRRLGTC